MHVTHVYTLRENTTEAGSQQTRKWAHTCIYVVVAQLLSYVRLFATPQTAAHRAGSLVLHHLLESAHVH